MNVSYLYTPALRAGSLITNRRGIEASAVVVDLEDSTHTNAKSAAREKVGALDFAPLAELGIKIGLRINTISCYDGVRDLDLVRALFDRDHCPIEYIFLPKVNHQNEVKIYRSLFSSLRITPRLYTFIETVEAVDNVDGIAGVSDALCFGQADLVAEMYSPNDTFINYARARLCIAAAKYSIPAIDTNSFDIEDLAHVEAECRAARSYGFTAKAAIHPKQVPAINRTFSVGQEILAGYQSTIDAYVSADTGFLLRGGEVLAPPFVAKARRMLEFYKRNSPCTKTEGTSA